MQKRVLVIPTLFCVLLGATVACTKTNTSSNRGSYAGNTTDPTEEDTSARDAINGAAAESSNIGPYLDGGPSAATDDSTANTPDASKTAGAAGTRGAAGKRGSAGAGGHSGRGGTGGKGSVAAESGSCCVEHTSSGCDNSAVQKCICEQLPDCCNKAWSQSCVLLTQGHYCEPSVRDCVCAPEAEGGWAREDCCKQEWTNFCEIVAVAKCNPTVPGCSDSSGN
jgi:hypothetical protein